MMSVASRAKAALAKLEGADLERLKRQVKPSADVWQQYLRFLALKVAAQDWCATKISPPVEVDALWHAHILDTRSYRETCELLGHFIDHDPDGGDDPKARAQRRLLALKMYEEAWGTAPEMWKVQEVGGRRAAPAVKEEGASARVAHRESINFKFVWTQDGTETRVKCHPWVPLDDLMKSYCQEKGVNFSASGYELEGAHVNAVQFMCDGYRIESHDTPESIEMEDGDVINVSPARVSTPGYVEIKVVAQDGNETFFKCMRTKPLINLMRAWCQQHGVGLCAVRFTFNGPVIREHETPEDLEMEDGDVIDVSAKMQGC